MALPDSGLAGEMSPSLGVGGNGRWWPPELAITVTTDSARQALAQQPRQGAGRGDYVNSQRALQGQMQCQHGDDAGQYVFLFRCCLCLYMFFASFRPLFLLFLSLVLFLSVFVFVMSPFSFYSNPNLHYFLCYPPFSLHFNPNLYYFFC